MNKKKFSKKVENFICDNCGRLVIGNGWTNHCPYCLFSKHVDINPGDRNCDCKGLMKPIEITQKKGILVITHKCQKCGLEKKNKISENDDFNLILKISNKSYQNIT